MANDLFRRVRSGDISIRIDQTYPLSEAEQASAPQMVTIMGRLMERATVTATDVARDLVDAVLSDRFLVMSHADARAQARLKRLSPELYFRRAQKATAGFLAPPQQR